MAMWIALVRADVFHGVGPDPGPIVLVAVEPAKGTRIGRTSILAAPEGLVATGVARAERDWQHDPCAPIPFEVGRHDVRCRRRQREAWRLLRLDGDLAPLLCVQTTPGSTRLYHRIEAGPAGVLFTALGEIPGAEGSAGLVARAVSRARGWFDAARPAFNPGMTHTRWKIGQELERKFTSTSPNIGNADAPADTWALHYALHDELVRGAWPGFIPEFNEEFHIWDYESEMFEVLAPAEAQGYIAFIPQVDGRTTVKYKRFAVDAELRSEDIMGDRPIPAAAFEHAAAQISGGRVRRLPGFRRKRFDCDLESLDTGNAYGIFFDTCRTTDGSNALLVQCEVEYLRTRALAPIAKVEEEFRQVCALTGQFLQRKGIAAEEGHYSKLTFARAVAQRTEGRRTAS